MLSHVILEYNGTTEKLGD